MQPGGAGTVLLGYVFGADLPGALTGITDERGVRLASYRYDSARRAIETTHAGGAGRALLSYLSGSQTSVEDALGTRHTYTFQTVQGVARHIDTDQPGAGCGPWKSASLDTNANAQSRTDWNGRRTERSFDPARNLEIRRVEAAGSDGYGNV